MTAAVHRIAGSLTIETVTQLFERGLDFAGENSLVVDLEQVLTVDSAAVSLLLAWVRQAQSNGLDLSCLTIVSTSCTVFLINTSGSNMSAHTDEDMPSNNAMNNGHPPFLTISILFIT